ncbi:MAG: SRPBCC family protein [Cyanobacteria bacterium P01_A01_bin.37]
MTLEPRTPESNTKEIVDNDFMEDAEIGVNSETANDAVIPDEPMNGAIANLVTITSEPLEGRKRRLSAKITIPHDLENIWKILTDYDQLSDFIPSLKESRKISCPTGGIRIEQVGSQSLLKIKFCARVVLDMFEDFPHRIDFKMVEGDFKEFYGAWILQPIADAEISSTALEYTLDVLPSRLMPVGLIEKKLSHNLHVNLTSIYNRANILFGEA